MVDVYLSIIIPAHNEEERLPPSLVKVDEFIRQQPYKSEVIVVENGSHDRTLEIAQSFQDKMPSLRVIQEQQSGKGLAVRSGMMAAQGQYRIFCDADFSMPVTEISKFIPKTGEKYDIAIASRELPDSKRVDEPEFRHLIGRVFNSLVRYTLLPGLQDTQCGFKAFRGDVADHLFRMQTLTGWSFDAELLFIAQRLGYNIIEVPITWYYKPGTRLHIVKDSIKMASDLFTIRRNANQGMYDQKTQNSS
ncbi:MAG: glycosyltransferase family 2 protein [Anaerolineaceae bacterium]|nr:glycosyltransferase family 2 protein [Anaerolineaceae bacterium]